MSIAAPGQEEDPVPEGHHYTFKKTLEGAMETIFINVATPKVGGKGEGGGVFLRKVSGPKGS